VDAEGGAFLDDAPVFAGGGEDQNCLGVNLLDHFLNGAEVKARRHVVALGVGVGEGLIGVDDPDDLDVGAVQQSAGGG
jgi:hypothetical protein